MKVLIDERKGELLHYQKLCYDMEIGATSLRNRMEEALETILTHQDTITNLMADKHRLTAKLQQRSPLPSVDNTNTLSTAAQLIVCQDHITQLETELVTHTKLYDEAVE